MNNQSFRLQSLYSWSLIAKRAIDIIGALFWLVVLSPLLLLIILIVKLDAPGPILFRRQIFGYRGQKFWALKFRTMVVNAHEIILNDPQLLDEYKRNLKIEQDPRVTRCGWFLRKTSLDELPQLVNILRGEMSFVGPRMLGDLELARYGDSQEKVLSVKPGLTGLWQVSGRHTVSFERRIALDLFYVDHWNLLMDFAILLKTVPAVISGKGAG